MHRLLYYISPATIYPILVRLLYIFDTRFFINIIFSTAIESLVITAVRYVFLWLMYKYMGFVPDLFKLFCISPRTVYDCDVPNGGGI